MKPAKITTIELDRERHFKINLNVISDFEDETGTKLADLQNNTSMKLIRKLLFLGLKWEDKDLTEESIGEFIDFDNFEYVMEKLNEAMTPAK